MINVHWRMQWAQFPDNDKTQGKQFLSRLFKWMHWTSTWRPKLMHSDFLTFSIAWASQIKIGYHNESTEGARSIMPFAYKNMPKNVPSMWHPVFGCCNITVTSSTADIDTDKNSSRSDTAFQLDKIQKSYFPSKYTSSTYQTSVPSVPKYKEYLPGVIYPLPWWSFLSKVFFNYFKAHKIKLKL